MREETGEVFTQHRGWITEGGYSVMPDKARDDAERRKQRQEHIEKIIRYSSQPSFCFTSRQPMEGLRPETVVRLVYLATYLRIKTDILYLTKRTVMTLTDLQKVLNVSDSTFRRFWAEASPQYVCISEDGSLRMPSAFFRRGNLTKEERRIGYMKVFTDAIRKLYLATPVSRHKHLGYVFLMLPFINIKFNVLCRADQIYEEDLDHIEQLSCEDFCKNIGYNFSNIGRLKEAYKHICFDVNGHPEPFCAFVDTGHTTRIFINPHILYSGDDIRLVEVLGSFCTPHKAIVEVLPREVPPIVPLLTN